MAEFTYTGSETLVFPDLAAPDGSTLVCKPGDTVTLADDPNTPLLVPVAAAPATVAPQTPSEAPSAPATPAPAA